MTLLIQTEFRGNIAVRHKLAIFHIVYKGPDEGIIQSGFSNILWAEAINMRTGKHVKATWEKGGSCILLGPIKEGKEGIIKLRCEGW